MYLPAIPFYRLLLFSCFANKSIYLCSRSCSQKIAMCLGQKYLNSNNLDFFFSRNMPTVLLLASQTRISAIAFSQCICVQTQWHNIEINQHKTYSRHFQHARVSTTTTEFIKWFMRNTFKLAEATAEMLCISFHSVALCVSEDIIFFCCWVSLCFLSIRVHFIQIYSWNITKCETVSMHRISVVILSVDS